MTTVFTFGHSNRSVEEVLDLLRGQHVAQIVDVRRFPGSRTHPQWNQTALAEALPPGLSYTWIAELGGRRYTPVGVESPNGWWRVKAFRDYADHMRTPAFADGLGQLLELSEGAPTAMMCSEAVPWRCHRRLITDALLVAGVGVEHIISGTRTRTAVLTEQARLCDGLVTYPPRTEGEPE